MQSTCQQDSETTSISPETINDLFAGLQPAFRHQRTGESHLAQSEPGIPASVYGFTGLPDHWIVERDEQGQPVALHPDVVAGYWRDARFIALSQLPRLPLDA
jgi:hypothetical protein